MAHVLTAAGQEHDGPGKNCDCFHNADILFMIGFKKKLLKHTKECFYCSFPMLLPGAHC